MTTQYLRRLSLVVARPNGTGLELGGLRVVFTVRRGDIQTPNSLDARIYNLNDDTVNSITTEFTQVVLKASYGDDPPKQIFYGVIKQVRLGREDQKNNYLDITAAVADAPYNFSIAAFTMAKGSTQEGSVQALIATMARAAISSPTSSTGGQAITQGYIPDLSTNQRVRAKVHFGLCRDEMRNLAANADCKWSIQDNAGSAEVTLIPQTSFIPGEAVLISPFTGLIGVPEQTQNGLSMRVLLNPAIKIGQLVKLDFSNVNEFRYGLDKEGARTALTLDLWKTTALNKSGLYYVMRADHYGDTRGNPWYTDLTCLGVDASQPLDSAPSAAIAPVFQSPPQNAVQRY